MPSASSSPTNNWICAVPFSTPMSGGPEVSVRIVRIMNHSPAALAEAFETLTGSAPLVASEA